MKTRKDLLRLALPLLLLAACKPKLDEPKADKGSLDVSHYVAIGNSITSGYADAALYYDGQQVAYPNLLAQQFKLIGGGDFKQPLVSMSSVGVGGSGNSKLVLAAKADCMGTNGLSPLYVSSFGDLSIFTDNVAAQGPFNNMGVPGAKSFHVPYTGYGFANSYFRRMISDPSTASILSEAVKQNPTFFSLFIGNNDVLMYALNGGSSDSITSVPVFNASLDAIVNAMTAKGAKGVIAAVPDITQIPYFTLIPYNGLKLDANQAAQLNAYYAPALITFTEGLNPFLVQNPTQIPGVRKMKPGELVLLSVPQDSLKCAGWGAIKPFAAKYVLTQAEVSAIQTAVAAYNYKLKLLADEKGLAFVDVNAFLATAKAGMLYNNVNITTSFISGGTFSLDGVHLTPLGNALLANEFIKSINAKYGSTIPLIDATKYRGVAFP